MSGKPRTDRSRAAGLGGTGPAHWVWDILAIVSTSAFLFGLWQVYPPACWMAGGLAGIFVWCRAINVLGLRGESGGKASDA